MPPHWLANADPAIAWDHQTWSELSARPDKARTLVVLPVHGFADHGLGLPLDVEETVGSAMLHAAIAASGLHPHLLVLPPFRFGVAPYPHTHFGVDAETALDALSEIVESVKLSGFARVLFFNTSPWNAELVSTAAIDARTKFDLSTYVMGTGGVGLGFHPADPNRVCTQAVAARLLGRTPAPSQRLPAEASDADFRPGNFARPAVIKPDPALDPEQLFSKAASTLSGLLGEIIAHGSTTILNGTPHLVTLPPIQTERSRELVAMTEDQLAAIPDKSQALVIIPTSAIEQHGHHLPLGTDAMLNKLWLAHALPKLAADAPVFVAPTITYGKSNEHLGFAGTITISARTLRRQLLALAQHLKTLGFRQVAVLNTHGGNSAMVVATLREIQTTLGLRAGMLGGYYRPVQTPQEAAFGFHAGEWETSLMLAGAPECVHMDRAVCEYPARIDSPGTLRPEGSVAVFAWKTSDISQSGVMGDAPSATTEKGVQWLDEASTALARKIESLLG
jgi:creatinine amidohydrolase